MKEDLTKSQSESQADQAPTPEAKTVPPEATSRALADLLHQAPKASQPESVKETAPAPQSNKFDLKLMFDKLSGKQPEAAEANEEHTISEVELDHHIEFKDQANPLPKPQGQATTADDQGDEPDDDPANNEAVTPISTVLANKTFDPPEPPAPTPDLQSVSMPPNSLTPEEDETVELYKTYAKYGFLAAVTILILLILIKIL